MTKELLFMGMMLTVTLCIVHRITNYQHQCTQMEDISDPFDANTYADSERLRGLPRGIIAEKTDLEMKPLLSHDRMSMPDSTMSTRRYLLAIAAGIKQKNNVNTMVQRFLPSNFTVILFHYDGKLDAWMRDLKWSDKVIHVVAKNQTKWWFAKRFLHPDVVSMYDYIFLWDEDLGVENFHPRKYLKIVRLAGLEISQPALDLNSTIIHHKITMQRRTRVYHTKAHVKKGNTRCNEGSEGPPCTGFVEGMAPVFSRSAWYCTWHLIQNDLVHGWGVDMKLGYCAQGDRTEKVGIVDSEFVVHKGIPTLGTANKAELTAKKKSKRRGGLEADVRMDIRRHATWEEEKFNERWTRAVQEDKLWADPYQTNASDRIDRNILN